MGWQPRLITRNPKGLLGLGRGTNLNAIVKAEMLKFTPSNQVLLERLPNKRDLIQVEHGEAHLGNTKLFKVSEKYEGQFYDFFDSFKAGKNSRHGLFLKSRINLIDQDFSFGHKGGLRLRVLGLEDWYEKRGIGHGAEGRYLFKYGNASARGTFNLPVSYTHLTLPTKRIV